MACCRDPLTPRSLSPKGARGELILLPSPPWGRGWLDEALSSVRQPTDETGEGVSPIVKSNMGHHTRLDRLGLKKVENLRADMTGPHRNTCLVYHPTL